MLGNGPVRGHRQVCSHGFPLPLPPLLSLSVSLSVSLILSLSLTAVWSNPRASSEDTLQVLLG